MQQSESVSPAVRGAFFASGCSSAPPAPQTCRPALRHIMQGACVLLTDPAFHLIQHCIVLKEKPHDRTHHRPRPPGRDRAPPLHRGQGPARHRRGQRTRSGRASTRSCHDLAPKNIALLAERDRLQSELDALAQGQPGPIADMPAYRAFLEKIGYLVPPPEGAKATTANVDAELALQAGPQLVVPILNARYALNAANARWGSLYDALYGTDVIPEDRRRREGQGLQPGARRQGHRVRARRSSTRRRRWPTARTRTPPATASKDGQLGRRADDGSTTGLADPAQFVGYQGDAASPSSVLLRNNGLHVDILIDRSTADRQDRRGRRQRPGAGSRAVHHPGPRGLGGRRRRRRQGARLPQLAGPRAGHADRRGHQGRQDLHPRPQCRTATTPAPTAGDADAARPLADVRAQRRAT